MKKQLQSILRLRDERGVTVVIFALTIIIILLFTALAIDIGYGLLTKDELQLISDATSLAATRELGRRYEGMTYAEQQAYVFNVNEYMDIVNWVASHSNQSEAAGEHITVSASDVVSGDWDFETRSLTPTVTRPDAIQVTARRDNFANSPIPTFFAKIFGINTIEVHADSTAALSAISAVGPGGLPIPVGISKRWFDETDGGCDQPLRMYPTGDLFGCVGWHTYDAYPPSASRLRQILDGLAAGTYESPGVTAGQTVVNFSGGTIASVFDEVKTLFDAMKGLNDGLLDNDDDSTTWTTTVVVYDRDDCSNPNQPLMVVGFATTTITQIIDVPEKIIDAIVICELIEPGPGGGGDYGTIGTIPNLVE